MSGLRQVRRNKNFVVELPQGSKVKSLLTKIGFKKKEIENLNVYVNGVLVLQDKTLKNKDDVWVGFVLGGG